MKNFHSILFISTLISGTLITISSYSWLSMWMGLEINLLSIIPLLKDKKNIFASEAALKYFIAQALASSILLFSIILSFNLYSYIGSSLTINMILMSALFIKVGAAPFHAWFPEVMEGLNWINGMIMLTWQKIAPMMMIFFNVHLTNFLFTIIIISSITSGILGLNQISLRKILAYSSINHISWMLASMLNTQTIWMFYFLIYTIISINMILIFNFLSIFNLIQLFSSMTFNKHLKIFFILNFLSLGGLPPFLGFFPKWLVINSLIINQFYLLSVLLIVSTLITLFFYLRITLATLIINTNEILIVKHKTNNFLIMTFNFITLSGLLICTLTWNFY
uniref:NADH-ubiquinone oxidoreductase chain 2 n=1 Tax=Pterolophia sp. ZJY-2019 TaxID=2604362 RepID=A0A5B9RH37_9CUCU|nr:NADH dehydrogenase subunit 2 [Pterolophia sp. ZJY-2019]QEG58693.1 NADH dehydrogenase subunit 2 [Pterolophia sp. ZJY-2019]